ncbi:MAG: GNAT family N-acetyltransferase [Piscinibacter sp.]|nr:GNAT family N-acetyltransferase [Piscinibacter sp.]
MSASSIRLRAAAEADAPTIAALSVQVFLDTYATEGVRPDLAREAFVEYSAAAFAARLREPARAFLLAEWGPGLVGFAEFLLVAVPAPAGAVAGAELVRLYVQPAFQGSGVGRELLRAAELAAATRGLSALWLTAWEGNHRALRFYAANGYEDIGATTHEFQGSTYANRVFARRLGEVR